ncbi:MAG: hypothetical protein F2532_01770, partial [Actinobacteria bacterium]|nr:hypothetical protein [Actinomycetota bacterium]
MGPGISGKSVRIGFIVPNPKTAAGGTGFVDGESGDAKVQVLAMVKYVNEQGGLAGREIDPVIRVVDSATDSVQQENAVCTGFTEEDKVFAVVLTGIREASARSCFAQANTVMIDAGSSPLSRSEFSALKPYLWAPSFTPVENYAQTLATGLRGQDFFGPDVKVGVLIESERNLDEAFSTYMKPIITAAGVKEMTTATFDTSSPGTQGSSAGAAVNGFKARGVNRVIFLGRPDMAGFFTSIAAPQLYAPRLSIGTFDVPNFIRLNPTYYPPAALKGAVGVGFAPSIDDISSGFPTKGSESKCVNIYTLANQEFAERSDAQRALLYCDAVLFLQAAMKNVDTKSPLNAYSFEAAAHSLGRTWQAASSLET